MHHYRKFNPDRIIYQIWIQHQLPNNSNLPGYIAKAYDNAWIEGILLKLAKANVRGRTLIWLRNFLTGRSIRTRVNHQLSEERATTKGVPQGSVLSPLLFNVMLSDFPTPTTDVNYPCSQMTWQSTTRLKRSKLLYLHYKTFWTKLMTGPRNESSVSQWTNAHR
jgi:hypothetical protein